MPHRAVNHADWRAAHRAIGVTLVGVLEEVRQEQATGPVDGSFALTQMRPLTPKLGLFAPDNSIQRRIRVYPQAIHKRLEIVNRTWWAY